MRSENSLDDQLPTKFVSIMPPNSFNCCLAWDSNLNTLLTRPRRLLYGIIPKFSILVSMISPKCSIVENDAELMLMALYTHILSHSSNILGCTHSFWLFMFWFTDENASFLHFFRKITNIRSWRCFSSSKIRTQFLHTFGHIIMIFKVMSQYFPALFKRIHYHIRSAKCYIHEISTS